jgi:hypothetical protein
MKIVNLTFRSALIGWFHCSSTCKREQARNSGEVYEHENSNKNRMRAGIQIIQQRSRCILIVPYELLKWLCWLDFSITWCGRLQFPTDEWIGRNILKSESESEYKNQKHWTAIYVLPVQGWDVETWPVFGVHDAL